MRLAKDFNAHMIPGCRKIDCGTFYLHRRGPLAIAGTMVSHDGKRHRAHRPAEFDVNDPAITGIPVRGGHGVALGDGDKFQLFRAQHDFRCAQPFGCPRLQPAKRAIDPAVADLRRQQNCIAEKRGRRAVRRHDGVELDHIHEGKDTLAAVGTALVQAKADIVGDGQVREKRAILGHEPDTAAMRRNDRRALGQYVAIQRHLAAVRGFEPADETQQGGLARSRWSDNRRAAARRD
eukprot:gene6974-8625_t